MSLDFRQGYTGSLRSVLSVVVYPIQYLVNFPAEMRSLIEDSLVTRRALAEENTRLRKQNLLLSSQYQKFVALENENLRIRRLLESSAKARERVLLADVVALDQESARRNVVLNKGSNAGVYIGQPIIDAHGVLGQVIHVGPFSCTGLLITDASHALPVQINRNGLRGVASGTGQGEVLEVSYMPVNADVKKGDLIVSSGLDGQFPADYPVGKIVSVTSDPEEPFAKIIAVPISQFKQAREVLLLWPFGDESKREAHVSFNP